jgi:hypothetical protein
MDESSSSPTHRVRALLQRLLARRRRHRPRMTMNSPGGIEDVKALVRRRHRIDRTLLADAAIPLDLVAERAGATS